ncbi:Transcription factor grauzone [Lucilia cuprina]|nr:Transcription factor grauzone [Lucilia cuprina]
MDSCLLCLELNQNLEDFIETNSTQWKELNITKIIEKHFWPIDTMYSCSKMCLSCWKQLENFNKFYKQIEEAHENFGRIQIEEDKISCNESENYSYSCLEQEMSKDQNSVITDNYFCDISEDVAKKDLLVEEDQKKEIANINEDPNDSSNSNNIDSLYNNDIDDSDNEPLRNSSESVKKKVNSKKTDIFIAKNFQQISCDICDTPAKNFRLIRTHFRNVHNQRAYLVCCNTKFYSKSTLVDHIHTHLNPDYFKCQHCDRVLANRQSFEKHMENIHSHLPEEEKKFSGIQCDKFEKSLKHQAENLHSVGGKQDNKLHQKISSGRVLRNHSKFSHEELIINDQNALEADNEVSDQIQNNSDINEHLVNKDPLEETTNFTNSSNREITKTTTQTNAKEDQNKEKEWNFSKTNISNSVNNNDKLIDNEPNQQNVTKSVNYKDGSKKIDKFIAKHFKQMLCNLCNIPFESFCSMKQHYLKVHKQRCFLVCCNKKFFDKCRFVDHLHTHLNPNYFKCQHCDKVLASRESLEKHIFRKHRTKGVNPRKHGKVSKYIENNSDTNKDPLSESNFTNSTNREITTKITTQTNSKDQSKETKTNPNSSSNLDKEDAAYESDAINKKNDQLIAKNFKQILCNLCNRPFENFGNLMAHSLKVHKQSSYIVCCNKKFFDKPSLVDHLHTHKNRMNLEIHMLHKQRTKSVKLKNTCEICGKSFAKSNYLRRHKICHVPPEEKNYASSYLLKKHRAECMVYRKKCHICGKIFTSSGGYRTHMNKHVKPPTILTCDICGIGLSSKQNLELHKENLHPVGGRQDHPCPVCHKILASKRALVYHHKVMHAIDYDYKCNICEKGFKRLVDLKDHSVIHNETPKCSWCPLTFKSRVSMYTHRKRMHPKEWKESKLEKYSGNLPPALAKRSDSNTNFVYFLLNVNKQTMDACLLCLELNKDLVDIIETNSTQWQEFNITKLLEKHFWPMNTSDCSWMCSTCWKQLESFNIFYTRIEEAHANFGSIKIKETKWKESNNESEEFSYDCLEKEMIIDKNAVLTDNKTTDQIENNDDISQHVVHVDPLVKSNATNRRNRKKHKIFAKKLKNSKDLNEKASKINTETEKDASNDDNSDEVNDNDDEDSDYEPDKNSELENNDNDEPDKNSSEIKDHFKCKHCGKVLSNSDNFQKHMLRLHRPKGVNLTHCCEICGKSFMKASLLRYHKLQHLPEEEKKFPCKQCGKLYPSANHLNIHTEAVHLKKFVKICYICGKSIVTSAEYKIHMDKHEGIPPPSISCDICGLLLTSERGLKRHKDNQHPVGGKQDHPCPVCHKISPTRKALLKHVSTMHKKGYDHKCNICEKAFKRAEALREHMASHTGTPLYTCSWCPKTFYSNGNMHAHRKRVHPKEWEEAKLQKYSGKLPILN